MDKPYIKVPTWDNGEWGYTVFATKEAFRIFVKGLFEEPGQYQFDETAKLFNEHARTYTKKKMFCEAPEGSKDFQIYWDTEKEKCRKGAIFINGDKQWYIPRDLYMWWNFLQISDKIKKTVMFPEVWDTHYHMALYNILAELFGKHSAILKKRQIGSSLYHMAKLINILWFERSAIVKMGASLKDYINIDKGSWLILEEYRNFLNQKTAWYRPMDPDKSAAMSWQQRLAVREKGRDVFEGNMSKITGTSFERSATAGVGGPCRIFFHEEAGIAPHMGSTFEYMLPALGIGDLITGLFIAAGSVGDLDHCEPLKEMILNPGSNSIYGVKNNLLDEHGTEATTGLFIPEQWSFPPYIDQYGNSQVEEALARIKHMRVIWEKGGIDPETGEYQKPLPPDKYQLRISQRPINIEEAFAIRKVSMFPVKYTAPQVKRIENNTYRLDYVELYRDEKSQVKWRPTKRQPNVFPTDSAAEDKRGCVVIHEYPRENAQPLKTYIGSVDPVSKGVSQNTDSLASVYIWEMATEVLKVFEDGTTESYMEGGKLVAWATIRYDDVNETNEVISMLVEMYNAYTTCEYNQGGWVNYMIGKRRQKYLALKEDLLFDKELDIKQGTIHKYGWYKTTAVWGKMLEYAIDSLSHTLGDPIYDENGEIKEIHYGVERIPDIWLLKEMQQYDPKKGNYDRIVAYGALMAFAEHRATTLAGTFKRMEKVQDAKNKLEDREKLYNFNRNGNPFRNIGNGPSSSYTGLKKRSPFKNLR